MVSFLSEVKNQHPDYHCLPVPPFGDPRARLLIVGLAPGMHGANRTGRPFTGDHAGILLYDTLHEFGFSSLAYSESAGDQLRLMGCRITNSVKCLPPGNKPVGAEINMCNQFLANELEGLPTRSVVLALGGIAHRAIVRALGGRQNDYKFGHGCEYRITEELTLLDSYHCSRYNTNTRRLTPKMFRSIFARTRVLLD